MSEEAEVDYDALNAVVKASDATLNAARQRANRLFNIGYVIDADADPDEAVTLPPARVVRVRRSSDRGMMCKLPLFLTRRAYARCIPLQKVSHVKSFVCHRILCGRCCGCGVQRRRSVRRPHWPGLCGPLMRSMTLSFI